LVLGIWDFVGAAFSRDLAIWTILATLTF